MMSAKKVASRHILTQMGQTVPVRVLGRTGLHVRAFGLGGQALLEQEGMRKSAVDLIRRAISLGVNYLDTAAIYGPSREYYGYAIKGHRNLVINSKVRERSYSGAKKELDDTFRLLQTPYIDIIQLHSIEDEKDKRALKRDGALQVLKEAKAAGKIGHIGLSGHHDPKILMDFMDEFPFETLLVALNPAVPQFMAAIDKARSMNMGVITMKVMSRGVLTKAFSAERLLHYAMARSDVAIVGCSNETDVVSNVSNAAAFKGDPGCPEMSPEMITKSDYFAKWTKHKGKWPSTYQPDWPEIQYD